MRHHGCQLELRRLSVGCFTESQAVALDLITKQGHISRDCPYLLPIETALDDIPALVVTATEAGRLRSGQKVLLGAAHTSAADPVRLREGAIVGARCGHAVIALARIENGLLRPVRVVNR